jgi:hypothetical protein
VKLTFTNCKIVVDTDDAGYGMIGKGGYLVFEHCLVDGSSFNDVTFPLIIEGGGSVTFCEFRGNTDNARLSSNTSFRWNYIHTPKTNSANPAHADGIEIYYGAREADSQGRPAPAAPAPHIVVENNYIDVGGAAGENASLNITSDFGPVDGVLVRGNTFLPGGNYAFYVRSDGYCGCGTASNVQVHNNRWFGDAHNVWGGYYGTHSVNLMSSVTAWSGNTLTKLNQDAIPLTLAESQP